MGPRICVVRGSELAGLLSPRDFEFLWEGCLP